MVVLGGGGGSPKKELGQSVYFLIENVRFSIHILFFLI